MTRSHVFERGGMLVMVLAIVWLVLTFFEARDIRSWNAQDSLVNQQIGRRFAPRVEPSYMPPGVMFAIGMNAYIGGSLIKAKGS